MAEVICKLFFFAVLPSCDKHICYCIAERISVFHGAECFRTENFSQWHATISTLQLCGSCSSKHVCSSRLLLLMPIRGWGSGAMLCSTVGASIFDHGHGGGINYTGPKGSHSKVLVEGTHALSLATSQSFEPIYGAFGTSLYIDYKYSRWL